MFSRDVLLLVRNIAVPMQILVFDLLTRCSADLHTLGLERGGFWESSNALVLVVPVTDDLMVGELGQHDLK